MPDDQPAAVPGKRRDNAASFTTTNWSLVLDAMATTPARASAAMERLCARYWYPVHAFIRRQVNDIHHAEDLTQGFFEFVITHDVFQQARKEKGRFRGFLLASLNNFLHNRHDHATAAKRGGGYKMVPLDEATTGDVHAGGRSIGPADSFDRLWAVGLIRRVMDNLREEFAGRGRLAIHDALLPHLTSEPAPGDYERMAAELAMETGAMRVALHRFRRRFGELLRGEVAYTVADPAEVEEEIRYLLSVLADA